MGELINGRTPEQIKTGLSCSGSRGNVKCSECAYCMGQFGDEDCNYECDQIDNDALALIERLEAKVPHWISVEERLPEEKINPLTNDFDDVICVCDFGGIPKRRDIRFYKFGCGHFLHGFQIMDGVVTHWMQKPELPELPKEGA